MIKFLVICCVLFAAAVRGAPVSNVVSQPPPNPNNWTQQCILGESQLLSAVGKTFSQVAEDAGSQAAAAAQNCSSDFQKHVPCVVTLDWTGTYAADVAALASAAKAKDPNAILCYVDSTVTSSTPGIGNFTITTNNIQIYPFSSQCASSDRIGYLNELNTACGHGTTTCKFTFANSTCN
eukprot:m.112058 g.112058  ORF g.112058 m.112058 type:complete len:179 (-) comp17027_c0_seq1:154-690(-)